MKIFRAQNFWYEARDWPLMETRVRKEWKGLDIVVGARRMRKLEERACR